MANWEGHPRLLQPVQQVQEPGELRHGVGLVPVGVGEVGKDALAVQAGEGRGLPDLLRRVSAP